MKSKTSRAGRENRETRQIVWDEYNGFYRNQCLFFVLKEAMFRLYFSTNGTKMILNDYSTFKDAKRGAERFLKRLQEAVK